MKIFTGSVIYGAAAAERIFSDFGDSCCEKRKSKPSVDFQSK